MNRAFVGISTCFPDKKVVLVVCFWLWCRSRVCLTSSQYVTSMILNMLIAQLFCHNTRFVQSWLSRF